MKMLIVAAGLSTALAACGSDGSNTSAATGTTQGSLSSCDLSSDIGYCLDFAPDAPAGEAKGNCDSANSTLGYHGTVNETAACPTTGRVGSCTYTTPAGIHTTYRYYGPKFTTASSSTNCTALPDGSGSFTAN